MIEAPHTSANGTIVSSPEPYTVSEKILGVARHLRVISVGAGASGLNLAHQISQNMRNIDLTIYEKNPEVGGTWYENRYPGCACDIPSHNYQFTWAPNPNWSTFYSRAPEILEYFKNVAKKYDLYRFINLNHSVINAEWVESDSIWKIKVQDNATGRIIDDWCHFMITASGILNNWKWPDIPGLHSFKGELFHSAAWNKNVSWEGKTVAVLGCGSSGVQIVPTIQPDVKQLVTFIRTPTWITAGFAQNKAGPNGSNFAFSEGQRLVKVLVREISLNCPNTPENSTTKIAMGHHTEVPGRKISLFNLAVVLALTLGSLTYGYTFSITSTTLGQPGWYLFFDLSSEATGPKYSYTQAITGTMNGLFCAGDFLGSIFIGWSCHAMGRKNSLWIASPLAIRGGALQAGAVHIGMFLIGRFIGGFAVGILIVLIPLFQAEIAPPAARGFLISQHGVVLVLGYSLAAWTGFACFFPTNLSFQWRFPLAEQCLWPLLMLILTPWIPESPRWLIMNDRMDDAWSVIIKLHGVSQNDTTSAAASFAREEFYQMKQQAVVDKATASGESFGTLFTKPSYRKRMLCAFFTMFASESTGILVVYNYSVLLYQGLGFDNKISLLLSALYVSVACAGNYISSILVDRVGRVKLFLIGFSGCLISLIFETVMVARYTGSTNKAGLRAGVFFLFIYIFFYGCCVDATTYVYCSEIFPSHIRARGVAFSLSILFLTALVYLEAAPTAFAHIGWKYYVVFLVVTLVNIFVVWWLFPETKGLSLEEIGELFGDDVAVQLTQLTMEERELLDQKILSEKSMGDEIHIEVNTERSEGN